MNFWILALVSILCGLTHGRSSDLLDNLSHYEVVLFESSHIHALPQGRPSTTDPTARRGEGSIFRDKIDLSFRAFGLDVEVQLNKNKELFHPDYKEYRQVFDSQGSLVRTETHRAPNDDHNCFYQGETKSGAMTGKAAVDTCHGGFRGILNTGHLMPGPNDEAEAAGALVIEPAHLHMTESQLSKHARQLYGKQDSYRSTLSTKYLQSQKGAGGRSRGVHIVYRPGYHTESQKKHECATAADTSVIESIKRYSLDHENLQSIHSQYQGDTEKTITDPLMHEMNARKLQRFKGDHVSYEQAEDSHHRHSHLEATSTDYVELLIVNDFERYSANGASTETLSATNINTIDSYYSGAAFGQGKRIVLRSQITFTVTDPYTLPSAAGTCFYNVQDAAGNTIYFSFCSSGEVDKYEVLDAFQNYLITEISVPSHDHAQLYSGYDFDGNYFGLASTRSICQEIATGSINSMIGSSTFNAALSAHELGHALGSNHDEDEGCATGFIMESSVSSQTAFSSCTITSVDTTTEPTSCLDNYPSSEYGTDTCGDGFINSGETCDCGSSVDCTGTDDPCCDATTCTLLGGSTCSARDPCCNNACQIVSATANKPCRNATDTTCDVTEICDGSSSSCPVDTYAGAGTPCTDASYGTGLCYQGTCQSANRECATVDSWQSSGAPHSGLSASRQLALESSFCTKLFCSTSSGAETSFAIGTSGLSTPFTSGGAPFLAISAGVPCLTSDGACSSGYCQCNSSNVCVASSQLTQDYYWTIDDAFPTCGGCGEAVARNVTCRKSDSSATTDIFCSAYSMPARTQYCGDCSTGSDTLISTTVIYICAGIAGGVGIVVIFKLILHCCKRTSDEPKPIKIYQERNLLLRLQRLNSSMNAQNELVDRYSIASEKLFASAQSMVLSPEEKDTYERLMRLKDATFDVDDDNTIDSLINGAQTITGVSVTLVLSPEEKKKQDELVQRLLAIGTAAVSSLDQVSCLVPEANKLFKTANGLTLSSSEVHDLHAIKEMGSIVKGGLDQLVTLNDLIRASQAMLTSATSCCLTQTEAQDRQKKDSMYAMVRSGDCQIDDLDGLLFSAKSIYDSANELVRPKTLCEICDDNRTEAKVLCHTCDGVCFCLNCDKSIHGPTAGHDRYFIDKCQCCDDGLHSKVHCNTCEESLCLQCDKDIHTGNKGLHDRIRLDQKNEDKPHGWRKCQICSDGSAVVYCVQCEKYYCDKNVCDFAAHAVTVASAVPHKRVLMDTECDICELAAAHVFCVECGLELCTENGCNDSQHASADNRNHHLISLEGGIQREIHPPPTLAQALKQSQSGWFKFAWQDHTGGPKCSLCDRTSRLECEQCRCKFCKDCDIDIHKAPFRSDHKRRPIANTATDSESEDDDDHDDDKKQPTGGAHGEWRRCGVCGMGIASVYCFNCSSYMCDTNGCEADAHKLGTPGSSHSRVDLEIQQDCELCGLAKATVWCNECGFGVCIENDCDADLHHDKPDHHRISLEGGTRRSKSVASNSPDSKSKTQDSKSKMCQMCNHAAPILTCHECGDIALCGRSKCDILIHTNQFRSDHKRVPIPGFENEATRSILEATATVTAKDIQVSGNQFSGKLESDNESSAQASMCQDCHRARATFHCDQCGEVKFCDKCDQLNHSTLITSSHKRKRISFGKSAENSLAAIERRQNAEHARKRREERRNAQQRQEAEAKEVADLAQRFAATNDHLASSTENTPRKRMLGLAMGHRIEMGIPILKVAPNSPAAKAGIKVGDIIKKVGLVKKSVQGAHRIVRKVSSKRRLSKRLKPAISQGQSILFVLFRASRTKAFSVMVRFT